MVETIDDQDIIFHKSSFIQKNLNSID